MDTRKIALVIAVAVFLVAGGVYVFGESWWWGNPYVPYEFSEARESGALVAEQIVFLAHQSLAGLEQIAGLDEQKKYSQALELADKELARNGEARQQAILLSSQLSIMAAYLEQINPGQAQALATEAVGYEVSLVNRLINYHGLLRQLYDLLQQKFKGEAVNSDQLVKQYMDAINQEIRNINELNQRFTATMEQFDRAVE